MGKRFSPKQLEKIKRIITDPEELDLILDSDDPVRWAEKHFQDPDVGDKPFKVKPKFNEILRCNRKNRALRTGRQIGKCVSTNTKISMSNGLLSSAQEIYDTYGEDGIFDLISTDNTTFKHKISKAIIVDNGIKATTRITTKSGHSTDNTSNHPYYIWRDNSEKPEWIPGEEILIGDRIAITRDLSICEVSKINSKLNSDEAELLGYLVGDGCTSQYTIKFTSENIELIDRINTILDNLNTNMILTHQSKYDYSFKIKNSSEYTKGRGNISWVTDFTRKYNLAGMLSKNKKLPVELFQSDNKTIASFLGSYWSTDGWICTLTSGKTTQIGICSASKQLITETRYLLLRLGIQSRGHYKSVKYKDTRKDAWQLLIMDSRDISLFQKLIPIFHTKKAEALKNINIKLNNSNTDTIPKGIWKYIKRIIKEKGISNQSLLETTKERLRINYSPNHNKLLKQTKLLTDSFLQNISTSDITWDIVKSVENTGYQQTYAITVPDTENLITDNFITHNTVHLCIDIFHNMFFNSDFVILIFVPEKKNMNRMLEIMANMLRQSDIKQAFSMGKKKKIDKAEVEAEYDYEIRCSSGSVCRFFFMGNNPNKARGQHAHGIIYIDEAEYLPEKAYDVIAGFPKADPNIAICACSTPSGLPNTWFRIFSERCAKEDNIEGEEFHIPTSSEENWAEVEPRLRDIIFDEVTWNLEVLALWTDALGAVYKKDIIDQAVQKSMMYNTYLTMEELRMTLEYINAPKFLGVDWNVPQNGVRLVELSIMFDKIYVTRNERISHELYTQTYTVQRILELHQELRYKQISVDNGYGSTQIELIHDRLMGMGQDPARVLNIVDAVKKVKKEIIYTSPATGARKTDFIEMRMKQYIVSLVGKYLEQNLVLTKEEDESRTGLVSELRGFRRKSNKKEAGAFEYTDNTHSVSALQIGIHGLNEWLEKNKKDSHTMEVSTSVDINQIIKNRINQQRIYGTSLSSRNTSGRRTGGLNGGQRRTII